MNESLTNLMHTDIVQRLGWSLLHSLWIATAIALLLAIALLALRRRSPQARYAAACAGLLTIIIGTAAAFIISGDLAPAPHQHDNLPELAEREIPFDIEEQLAALMAERGGAAYDNALNNMPLLPALRNADLALLSQHRRAAEDRLLVALEAGHYGAAVLLADLKCQRALPILRKKLLTARHFYWWEGTYENIDMYMQDSQFPQHTIYVAAIESISGQPVATAVALTDDERRALEAEVSLLPPPTTFPVPDEYTGDYWAARWLLTRLAPDSLALRLPQPAATGPSGPIAAAIDFLRPAIPAITIGWLCGVLALSLWRLAGWIGVCRLRRAAGPPADAHLHQRLTQLAYAMRVTRPVRLLESALVRVPLVIGWLRPVILLPLGFATGLSVQQIEAILAHELAHIRRLDYLVNLLQAAAETLLFYHPAVWWISRRIRAQREQCCDDAVLALGADPVDYAQSLLQLAARSSTAQCGPAHSAPDSPDPTADNSPALAATGRRGELARRVSRLLGLTTHEQLRPGRLAGLTIAALLATMLTVGIFLVGCHDNDAATRPPSTLISIEEKAPVPDAEEPPADLLPVSPFADKLAADIAALPGWRLTGRTAVDRPSRWSPDTALAGKQGIVLSFDHEAVQFIPGLAALNIWIMPAEYVGRSTDHPGLITRPTAALRLVDERHLVFVGGRWPQDHEAAVDQYLQSLGMAEPQSQDLSPEAVKVARTVLQLDDEQRELSLPSGDVGDRLERSGLFAAALHAMGPGKSGRFHVAVVGRAATDPQIIPHRTGMALVWQQMRYPETLAESHSPFVSGLTNVWSWPVSYLIDPALERPLLKDETHLLIIRRDPHDVVALAVPDTPENRLAVTQAAAWVNMVAAMSAEQLAEAIVLRGEFATGENLSVRPWLRSKVAEAGPQVRQRVISLFADAVRNLQTLPYEESRGTLHDRHHLINHLADFGARPQLLEIIERQYRFDCCAAPAMVDAIVACGQKEDAWLLVRKIHELSGDGAGMYLSGALSRLTGLQVNQPSTDTSEPCHELARRWAEALLRAGIGRHDHLYQVHEDVNYRLSAMLLKEGLLWFEQGEAQYMGGQGDQGEVRWQFLPAGEADWRELKIETSMGELREAAVSPDRRHIALVTAGEGHPILDIFNLPAIITGQQPAPLFSDDPYPDILSIVRWDDKGLVVRSGLLLTHPGRHDSAIAPVSLGDVGYFDPAGAGRTDAEFTLDLQRRKWVDGPTPEGIAKHLLQRLDRGDQDPAPVIDALLMLHGTSSLMSLNLKNVIDQRNPALLKEAINQLLADITARSGARAELILDKQEYFIGENILLHYRLTNTGQKPFTITMGGDYRGTTRPTRFKVTAVDAEGHAADDPAPVQWSMGGLESDQTLGPGEQHISALQLHLYRHLPAEGLYTVSVYHDLGWDRQGGSGNDIPREPRRAPVATATIRLRMPDKRPPAQPIPPPADQPQPDDRGTKTDASRGADTDEAAARKSKLRAALSLTLPRTADLPLPPAQSDEWKPPETRLPDILISATRTLFEQGLADPRRCEYRQVEVYAGSVWSDGGLMSTHAWVLPQGDGEEQRFAICWNGLVYPVRSVGQEADLPADVRKAIEADKEMRRQWEERRAHFPFRRWLIVTPEGMAISLETIQPLHACLLLRIDEVQLAEELWQNWLVGFHPNVNNNRDHLKDPYVLLAAEWTWALFSRAVCAHMRADDRLALIAASQLAKARKAIMQAAEQRNMKEVAERDMSFLAPLDNLLADQQRRARENLDDRQLAAAIDEAADQQQRIRLLVQRLENCRARQFGQPGGIDFTYFEPIVQDLIKEGLPAVEPLLECYLHDTRLTRSVVFHRDFFRDRTVLGVHRPAVAALSRILRSDFGDLGPELLHSPDPARRALAAPTIRAIYEAKKQQPRP